MNRVHADIRVHHPVVVSILLLMAATNTWSQTTPTAPQVSNGSYTVTFLPASNSVTTYLEERVGPNGTWAFVNNSTYVYANGVISASFSGKPVGEYFYRVNALFSGYYGGTWWAQSEATRVQVISGPLPSQDLMSNQLRYGYLARSGDINADGRSDVYVSRTSGGVSGNGTLDSVILRRLADGSFTPDVPSSSQISTVSNWPVLNTRITVRDFNIDGYADVVLPELGNALSGAVGQVIVSSGSPQSLSPQKVIPMNAKYDKFMSDTSAWIASPSYFVDNAPTVYYPIYGLIPYCTYYAEYGVWCGSYYGVVGYYSGPDLSAYDSDSVNLRYSFNKVVNGLLTPRIQPGDTDAVRIDDIFRSVFGVSAFRSIIRTNCYDYQYDPETGLPCIEFDVFGTILLTTLKNGKKTEPTDWRPLTVGEKAYAAGEGLQIVDVNSVRVYHRGYGIWWVTAETQVMAPDGHIYIGRAQYDLLWSEDYSVSSADQYSRLLHELMHVYQVRTRGCGEVCMAAAKGYSLATAGYTYWPLTPYLPFFLYNIEQQAEMVQDRFRRNPSIGLNVLHTANVGADWQSLDNLIPF